MAGILGGRITSNEKEIVKGQLELQLTHLTLKDFPLLGFNIASSMEGGGNPNIGGLFNSILGVGVIVDVTYNKKIGGRTRDEGLTRAWLDCTYKGLEFKINEQFKTRVLNVPTPPTSLASTTSLKPNVLAFDKKRLSTQKIISTNIL